MKEKEYPNEILLGLVEEFIKEGKSVDFRVKGFSMRPFLRNNLDIVTFAGIKAKDLRVGMVVLFHHKGTVILHRIRKIEGDRLIIKGDGNYRVTEIARSQDVIAYVCEVKKGGGSYQVTEVADKQNVIANVCEIKKDKKSFVYGSARYKRLTFWSLLLKLARTFYGDIKTIIKKINSL